jgi:hypothetical protein
MNPDALAAALAGFGGVDESYLVDDQIYTDPLFGSIMKEPGLPVEGPGFDYFETGNTAPDDPLSVLLSLTRAGDSSAVEQGIEQSNISLALMGLLGLAGTIKPIGRAAAEYLPEAVKLAQKRVVEPIVEAAADDAVNILIRGTPTAEDLLKQNIYKLEKTKSIKDLEPLLVEAQQQLLEKYQPSDPIELAEALLEVNGLKIPVRQANLGSKVAAEAGYVRNRDWNLGEPVTASRPLDITISSDITETMPHTWPMAIAHEVQHSKEQAAGYAAEPFYEFLFNEYNWKNKPIADLFHYTKGHHKNYDWFEPQWAYEYLKSLGKYDK